MFKSFIFFAFGTFISRITGLARDVTINAVFGAGYLLDSFIIAFRIPNLLRELLAEGALSSSFTKVYSQLYLKSKTKAYYLIINCLSLFLALTSFISLIGILFSHEIINFLNFGKNNLNSNFIPTLIGLTQIMFPYIIFVSLGSIINGILYHQKKFFISASSNIIFNLTLIFCALFLTPIMFYFENNWTNNHFADISVLSLGIGVILGGFLQLVFQIVTAFKLFKLAFSNIKYSFIFKFNKDVLSVLKLMTPMILASSSAQLNIIVNTSFAMQLEHGSVTWLNNAFRLLQLPIGLFGVGLSVVILPKISILSKSKKKLSDIFEKSISIILWFLIPSTIFLILNSNEICYLIFRYGKYLDSDVTKTSLALQVYGIGILGYGFMKVFTPFYYSLEKTNLAMRIALIGVFINIIFNYILIYHYKYIGLALSTSIVLSLNAILLFVGLMKMGLYLNYLKILKLTFIISLASLLSIILNIFIKDKIYDMISPSLSGFLYSFTNLFILGSVQFIIFSLFGFIYYILNEKTYK